MPANPFTIISDCAEVIRPPQRMSIWQWAESQRLVVDVPGRGIVPYTAAKTHYMKMPLEDVTDRRVESIIFIGGAQAGKTLNLVVLKMLYSVLVDMMDTKLIEKDRVAARDFVKLNIDRFIEANQEIRESLMSLQSDTLSDKTFRSGVMALFGWPSQNQLAGRSLGRMILTDVDRYKDDVGGEGSVYAQAIQRIKSFLSRGKIIAESSPSSPVTDPIWSPPDGNRHIYPPTKGGVGMLYNQGTKFRLYAKCPHCATYFLPIDGREGFDDTGRLICTENGCVIEPGGRDERLVKSTSAWAAPGQVIDPETGIAHGDIPKTTRRSYWMGGWGAAYEPWRGLIDKYNMAHRAFIDTGSEGDLKNVMNANFSAPFIPAAAREGAKPYQIWLERSKGEEGGLVAPEWTRCIFAQVDVQGNRFECMIVAIGPKREQKILTRFALGKSPSRKGDHIRPGEYVEDWSAITKRLVDGTYRVEGYDGELRVLRTMVDYHGQRGVSDNARHWYRSLPLEKQRRVYLARGQTSKTGRQLVRMTRPATVFKGQGGKSTGDVPVYEVQTNAIKDEVWAALGRDTPGPGYIHFAPMEERYFRELTAEYRNEKGHWINPPGRRNETFDLLCNCHATWVIMKGNEIKLTKPPGWFAPIEENSETTTAAVRRRAAKKPPPSGGMMGGISEKTAGWF